MQKVDVIIPTLNAGPNFPILLDTLMSQELVPDNIVILDSVSDDGTPEIAADRGCLVIPICRKNFCHGRTRQIGVEISNARYLVFLTQDVLMYDSLSLRVLIDSFTDDKIGAAFGRQLPHADANPIAAHGRRFNYPEFSRRKTLKDASVLGLKTPFMSNSFAAYDKDKLLSVGGFPSCKILSEDVFVAGKMLIAGFDVFYCADAKVFHSHNYSIIEEFKRYFDTGCFYGQENWIKSTFGAAESEGLKFLVSEFTYLLNTPCYILSAIIRTFAKYVAFKLGSMESILPLYLKRSISMNKLFWDNSVTFKSY